MESLPSTPPAEPRGLPPVTPPSGRFIAQLFLVPGMIVLLAVLLLLAFRYLFGGAYEPANFLRQLDSDNADIRWRGASDLAQVLKRPESLHLKSDPVFALDLAKRLHAGLDDLRQEEQRVQEKTAQASQTARDAAWGKPLDPRRNYVNFLAAAMGDFMVPVGIPLLSDIVLQSDSPDPKSILRRRVAMNALVNLGENIKEFHKLSEVEQTTVIGALVKEAETGDVQRAVCARNGLYYLAKDKLPSGTNEGIVYIDQTLAKVSEDQDQFLREWVAFAFNFWNGPLAEPTLLKLSRDRGFGTLAGIND